MEKLVDLRRLGGILPKRSRKNLAPAMPLGEQSKPPPVCSSIGLDTTALRRSSLTTCPYLSTLSVPLIVSIAGRTERRIRKMTARLAGEQCMRRSNSTSLARTFRRSRFRHRSQLVRAPSADCRRATQTPHANDTNVTSIAAIAKGAEAGGSRCNFCSSNTCLGMAIDWRRRRPMLCNVLAALAAPR